MNFTSAGQRSFNHTQCRETFLFWSATSYTQSAKASSVSIEFSPFILVVPNQLDISAS